MVCDGSRRPLPTRSSSECSARWCSRWPSTSPSVRRSRAVGRVGWWTCVGLIGGGLMFSVSRSAILGLTAAAIVLLCGWSAQRRVRMAVAGLGFLVVIKFVSPGLLGAFLGLFKNARNDSSIQWRTHDYATARSSSRSTSGSAGGSAPGTRRSTRSSTTSTC